MHKYRIRYFVRGDKFTEDWEETCEYEAEGLQELARIAYMDYWRPLSNLASGARKVGVFFERHPCKYFEMHGWQDDEPIDEDTLYQAFYWERIRRHQDAGVWMRVSREDLKKIKQETDNRLDDEGHKEDG